MKFQSKPLEIPVVWRNYQKSLLSDVPLNSPTVSAAQGRSWAQLTSNLIHNGQVCFQVFQGKISALHEAQSSYRWYLSQEKCKIPKQGEQKKRKNRLMEENLQLLDFNILISVPHSTAGCFHLQTPMEKNQRTGVCWCFWQRGYGCQLYFMGHS